MSNNEKDSPQCAKDVIDGLPRAETMNADRWYNEYAEEFGKRQELEDKVKELEEFVDRVAPKQWAEERLIKESQ